MSTIGLCMIVKNESEVILRCLESARPIIDYVLIEDTGSTDGTQAIIREWLDRTGIPGEVYDEPWRDFAYNRSHVLATLREKESIDYALILDADDHIVYGTDFDAAAFKREMSADVYDVELRNEVTFRRCLICSNRRAFRYRGVLHEFLERPADAATSGVVKEFYVASTREGSRGQDPEKYRKDAEILKKASETEEDPLLRSRYAFYLAQSYQNAGEKEQALEAYLKRAELGHWSEEVFLSLYCAGHLQHALGRPLDEVIATYRRAADAAPSRAEAYHAASRLCRENQKFGEGYDYARRGLAIPLPADGLFVEPWIYEFGLLDELSVCAYWVGQYRESLEACERLLREAKFPGDQRERIEENARIARERVSTKPKASAPQAPAAIRSNIATLNVLPKISLVICSRNRAAQLAETLSKLDLGDLTRYGVELTLIDSASDDSTLEVMREFKNKNSLIVNVDRADRPGLGLARNIGVKLSLGDVIVFTDDDCYLDPNYFSNLSTLWDGQSFQYGGGQILIYDASLDPRVANLSFEQRDDISPGTILTTGSIQGANMFFAREVFERAGLFNEDMGAGTPFACEDIEIATRASMHGFRGVRLPELKVFHNHGRKRGTAEADQTVEGYDFGRGAYYAALTVAGFRQVWELPAAVKLPREIEGAERYLEFVAENGRSDEAFVGLYAAGRLQQTLGRPLDEIISSYLRAANAAPSRAEAYHAASLLCRDNKRFAEAYEYARHGLTIPLPDRGLLIEPWIYEYGLLDELSISAFWIRHYSESLEACERLLRDRKIPIKERERVKNNANFAREALSPKVFPTTNIPVAEILMGGENACSADGFAQLTNDLLRPSTSIIHSPHVDLLRDFLKMGDEIFETEKFALTRYWQNARQCIALQGHYFEATTIEGVIERARRLVRMCNGERIMPRTQSETPDGKPITVRPIKFSNCYELVDGNHRLAVAVVRGEREYPCEILTSEPSLTPMQQMVMKSSWTEGDRLLYQPIHLPELSSWPIVRRCTDRFEMMKTSLAQHDVLSGSYLDVGSSYGWFVDQMSKRGYRAFGVDRDVAAIAVGSVAYGLDLSTIAKDDLVNFLSHNKRQYDVVSCFSVLHHYALGKEAASAIDFIRLVDKITGTVLFLDTGEAHEGWFKPALKEWTPEYIAGWLRRHTSFASIEILGIDEDGKGRYEGQYGRHLFACYRNAFSPRQAQSAIGGEHQRYALFDRKHQQELKSQWLGPCKTPVKGGQSHVTDESFRPKSTSKRLGIIVPYRNREEHLNKLLPHLISYFQRQETKTIGDLKIIIAEQADELPFNRGSLLNVGFLAIENMVDYVCFHDVDYLPMWADYSHAETPTRIIWWGMHTRPIRVSDRSLWTSAPRIGLGAVSLLTNQHFRTINGYSNRFFGWGFEDKDLAARCGLHSLTIAQRDGTFIPLDHDNAGFLADGSQSPSWRKNEQQYTENQREYQHHGTAKDGLSSLTVHRNSIEHTTVPGLDPGERADVMRLSVNLNEIRENRDDDNTHDRVQKVLAS